MKVLRTPDEQFENLPDYDFLPTYTAITDDDGTELRVHSIDVGPPDSDPILLMYGNPTWVYLYRHMIPLLEESGRRIIAVDLVGCGRSDKPARRKDYALERHKQWMSKRLLANDLTNITLFCQDWGGTLGLDLVARNPERFNRVVVSNSNIPTGVGAERSSFLRLWLKVMKFAPGFPWKWAFRGGFRGKVQPSDAEFAAYRAPFPRRKFEAGIVKFPLLITLYPDHPEIASNLEAWDLLGKFDKPMLTLLGDKDPVSRGMEKDLQNHVPGCQGQEHKMLKNVGHFSQEEAP
ncbi:haloalkane dehalogenase [Porticoccus sp.]|uniref:haloalkane dehalogenase n=1 Tax=Porticoccus sp. TaxID=2024853 RepID=UPI003F698F28